jgi:hypothetical protein
MPRAARLGLVQTQPPQHRHSLGLPGPDARHHYVARKRGRVYCALVKIPKFATSGSAAERQCVWLLDMPAVGGGVTGSGWPRFSCHLQVGRGDLAGQRGPGVPLRVLPGGGGQPGRRCPAR